MQGYVYIIKSETGHYKIGRSVNVPSRMRLFAVKLPFDFEIIHVFPCSDMAQAEKELHLIFRDKHQRGEWYNLTNQDEAILRRIDSFNNHGEFQKLDRDGHLWGMPELWTKLPDWKRDFTKMDRWTIYHETDYGLLTIFRQIYPVQQ